MAAKRGPTTASELLETLNADPEWVARKAARDRELAERAEILRQEERPLLDDLARAGFPVDSVWQLGSTSDDYADALPILLAHLARPYSPPVREGIARSLAVRGARTIAWDALLEMVRSGAVDGPAADGVMAAISAMARPRDLGTLIELIGDRSLGSKRLFLVRNLMRSKRPEARATLLRLQDDPDLSVEIAVRLKRRPG